jgi:HlyD family secretion protein
MTSHPKQSKADSQRRAKRVAVGLAVAGVLAALGGIWAWQAWKAARPVRPAAAAVRTAKVHQGRVEHTIRLTGVTAAERYAGLVAPQLRGSRGGGGLNVSIASRTSRTYSISGTFASTSSSSTTTSASTASRASTSGTSAASTGGESGGSEQASAGGGGGGGGRDSGSLARSVGGMTLARVGGGGGSSSVSSGGGGRGGGGGGGAFSLGLFRGGSDFTLTLEKVVPPGTFVRKGDVVAEFDRQYMLTRLDDYRATMDQVEAGMRILEADLEVERKSHQQSIEAAKADLEKARIDLKTVPVQSAIMTERLKLLAEQAEAKYKQLLKEVSLKEITYAADRRIAELERQQALNELRRAEANADRLLVRAPIDGVVVMESIFRSGEMARIQAGDQLQPGMLFMRIVDMSSMLVQARANQVDVERLRIGQRARIRFDAYPDLELPAHVHAIAPMPTSGGFRASYVKEVPVVLKIDKLDPRVIPDLSVSADVVLEEEDSAVVAPLAGIFRDSPDGVPYVFVQKPGGWERRPVELGVRNHIYAAVRSGLRPGEVIALERPPVGGK